VVTLLEAMHGAKPLKLVADANGCLMNTSLTVYGSLAYPQVHMPAAYGKPRTQVPIYRLAKQVQVGPHAWNEFRRSRMECSHLCGNKDCFHPKHICFESSVANKSRQACHRAGLCLLGHTPLCEFPHSPADAIAKLMHLRGVTKAQVVEAYDRVNWGFFQLVCNKKVFSSILFW